VRHSLFPNERHRLPHVSREVIVDRWVISRNRVAVREGNDWRLTGIGNRQVQQPFHMPETAGGFAAAELALRGTEGEEAVTHHTARFDAEGTEAFPT
jgi:hypothetical protein